MKKKRTSIEYRDYHTRLHPVTFELLRIHKFHTQRSINDLINFLLKEALQDERIKQKVLSMYIEGVSEYWITDWRDQEW